MVPHAERWMERIDKSGLPEKYKAWCYQHGILLRITWALLMYEVSLTKVESLERMFNRHFRDGLEFQKVLAALVCIVLVQNFNYPCLPLQRSSKLQKTRQVIKLRDRKDKKVKEANVGVRTGRKWVTRDAVEDAESRLRHKDIAGVGTFGRLGLGNIQHPLWESAVDRQRRDFVQQEVRRSKEEERQVRAIGMRQLWQYT